jgi:putative ABC transport system permease protein
VKLRRFSNLSLRSLGARPQRTVLTAVGIVLGVGIVFGVLTLSNTCLLYTSPSPRDRG